MPSPSEKPATAGKSTFAAEKSSAEQTVVPKTKDPDLAFIPAVVKHMTLAIYDHKYNGSGDGVGGPGLNSLDSTRSAKAPATGKNFKEAFAIARGQLADYKHLTPGSKNGPIGRIQLTGSGRQLESKHRREAGGGKKSARFDMLYEKYLAPKPTASQEKREGA